MTRTVTAELLMLRKRAATWILLGIWTFLGIFSAYVIPYALDPEDSPGGIGRFLPESFVGNLLAGFPFFGGVFALMLGVFALGSEYGWDTLKTLFTQRPGRLQVFAAKLAALAIVLIPFVLAIFTAGAVASYVIAQIEDAPANWPSAWLLARAIGAGWLILAVRAALGVLLGVLTRGTSLAIGVGILYALVIEGLLSAFRRQRQRPRAAHQRLPARQRILARHGPRRLNRDDRLQRAGLLQRPLRGQRPSPGRPHGVDRRVRRFNRIETPPPGCRVSSPAPQSPEGMAASAAAPPPTPAGARQLQATHPSSLPSF